MDGGFDSHDQMEANQFHQQQYVDGKAKDAIGDWQKDSNVPIFLKITRSLVILTFALAIIGRAFAGFTDINRQYGTEFNMGFFVCLSIPVIGGGLLLIAELWQKK